jgi:hypothetical protein
MIKLHALTSLADKLDKQGLLHEANEVDGLIKLAVAWPRITEWLHKQYEHLRQLFSKKKNNPGVAQEYDTAAANKLDDMLRRKQSGPPNERIFLWFCNQFPNSCQTCHSRHGRMRTLIQWKTEGMPGPAVCEKDNCACYLVPMAPGGALAPGGPVQMDEDGNVAAGIIGLREDNSGQNMNQGFMLEPFFSDTKTD